MIAAAPIQSPAVPKRPNLDPALYRPSHIWAALYIGYAFSLFALPAYGNYAVAGSGIPLWAKIPLIAAFTILSAFGLNMMGFVGHEGMHGSLFRNRRLSALTGLFTASAVSTYFEMGFAISHWNHHRYTNQKDDPDIAPVRILRKWWQRLLFTRIIYNFLYLKHTLTLALGKTTRFKFKTVYSHSEQVFFARSNLVFAAAWGAGYAWIGLIDMQAGIYCVLLPTLAVNFVGACQIYIDHAGLEDRIFGNSWSRTSKLMTALFFGANYHMEHHAYPGIPCYRLPKVHRILRDRGLYSQATPIVPGFFAAYRQLSKPYFASGRQADFNAFEKAV